MNKVIIDLIVKAEVMACLAIGCYCIGYGHGGLDQIKRYEKENTEETEG